METKTGWWKVSFDLRVEGQEVRFSDLSEVTQEHIYGAIRNGFRQGSIVEEIEHDEDDEESDEQS
jgi:hypothetical protein